MDKNKSIKSTNRKWLINYVILSIVIFYIFAGLTSFSFDNIEQFLGKFKNPNGFFILISFPISIVLEGLLNNKIKEVLIFWRLRNPLPGSRAFTVIAKKDPRINIERLQNLLNDNLPKNPYEQNSEWFQLYKKFGNELIVYESHKSYLLTRDMASLTTILIPIILIAHTIFKTPAKNVFYHILLLLGFLLMFILSSRNYAYRFVANVLVEATTEKE